MNPQPTILTVDDDPDLSALVNARLGGWGYRADSVSSAAGLWRRLERSIPDVLLLDVFLGDADGSELVREIGDRVDGLPVIMITRSTSVEAAVRCMKHGAADFITKPLDFDRLRQAVESAAAFGRFSRQSIDEKSDPGRDRFGDILGASPAMRRLYRRIENAASAEVPVLILGETGTGKELVARTLHQSSRRRRGPWVPVNAAAIPSELIESALFGHQKGAFTGAHRTHLGYCEQADGGTLFLDEIAEMDVGIQAKLLRFLQDYGVQRVGSGDLRKVDVRVLAATNVEPGRAVAEGRLREDLFYRLRVVSLEVPPLRAREGDVRLLAEHFLRRAARRHDRDFRSFSPSALAALESCPWPGNVRQLENVIEEAVVLYRGDELEREMLPAEVLHPELAAAAVGEVPVWSAEEETERRAVAEALVRAEGDPAVAAVSLGISRATIYRRMKKYGLIRPK